MSLSLAATVLMLRDTEAGLEVFMVKRHKKMGFAGGALVFPGGRLDDADGDESHIRFCTGGEHLSPDERALRVCAIRETFEESGVLLAHDGDASELLSGGRAEDLQARYRDKLNAGETGIWEMAAAENLKLACESLTPFAHWITPESRPRRYDTKFYLIAAPQEQAASHDRVESVASTWTTPAQAMADADAGLWTIVFVTRSNLTRLAESGATVADAIAHAGNTEIVPLMPKLTPSGGGFIFSIPEGHGYSLTELYQERPI
ncbi:MAG: NUDIX domain-containing protein [Rhodospirillales bacterium]|jgi:8-oxo-dGTP pyrophosphatase MutT (NUDIX family)|nr:NUDIX domain-containing protein [Rhodospirillales bacterium]MDP6644024.1 NUDIX domain-containing protein [Rhodospirillales bacterium]MDP6843627.1 NUDIX domain-containing protein [Rhodospirillales bacterium]|tara:strand:- start:50 stop:832 length:783 start_codon:yes stop_codon:yes gene_type:complete